METGLRTSIGLLGGTFNPVHMGHLILAQGAMETFDLSRVLFIPCAVPPHKDATGLLSADRRKAMLDLAVEGDPRFEVSDIEIKRRGVSYAVDTVAELTKAYPNADLYFIIGTDTLMELHLWREIYSLLTLCTFVTFARPGLRVSDISEDRLHLDPPWPERLLKKVCMGREIEISSSDIRHRIAEGMGVRYLVPDAVEMYICEHGLYGK